MNQGAAENKINVVEQQDAVVVESKKCTDSADASP